MNQTRTECGLLARRLEAFLTDRLPPEEEEGLRRHLAHCAGCRDSALEREPALLFLTLEDQRKDEFFWAAMWRDIQEGLPPRGASSSEGRALTRRHLWAAAAAVLAIGLAALTPLWWQGAGPKGETVTQVVAPPLDSAPPARVVVDDPNVEMMIIESSTPIVMLYDERIDL